MIMPGQRHWFSIPAPNKGYAKAFPVQQMIAGFSFLKHMFFEKNDAGMKASQKTIDPDCGFE